MKTDSQNETTSKIVLSKLALSATLEIEQGRRDQVLRSLMAHRDRCLKDEPGTLRFEILVPREDDAKLLLVEVYRDDAAFDVHRNGPSIAQFRQESAGMVKLFFTKCALVE